MNVIGITRTIPIRTVQVVNGKRKLVQKLSPDGQPETKNVPIEVWRVTKGELDGSFGPDRNRPLVVGLCAGDTLAFRPHGTRRLVTISLIDVYRITLKRRAEQLYASKQEEKKKHRSVRRALRQLNSAHK